MERHQAEAMLLGLKVLIVEALSLEYSTSSDTKPAVESLLITACQVAALYESHVNSSGLGPVDWNVVGLTLPKPKKSSRAYRPMTAWELD